MCNIYQGARERSEGKYRRSLKERPVQYIYIEIGVREFQCAYIHIAVVLTI